MEIDKILISGDVERFHSCVGVKKQLLSSHQWGVALLVQHFNPSCRKEVILAAMTHDCAELKTGDIPADFKIEHPEVRPFLQRFEEKINREWGIHYSLTHREQILLKIADAMEGMYFCMTRLQHGEQYALQPLTVWHKYIVENYDLNVRQAEFLTMILGEE